MISFANIDVDTIDMDIDHTDYIETRGGQPTLVTMSRSHWWMLEYIIKEMGHTLPQILQEIETWNAEGDTLEHCLQAYIEGYTNGLKKLISEPV